jgi:hypothetical protein
LYRFIHTCAVLVCVVAIVALQGPALGQAPSNATQSPFHLQSSVMGSAGATGASAAYRSKGTMAQPTPTGVGAAGGRVLYAGFWAKSWVTSGLLEDPFPGPLVTRLHPSFPNPFVSATTIGYSLAERADVALSVFSVGGRIVRSLVSAEEPPGFHQVVWNGKDDRGQDVGPGVYFCRFEAGSHRSVKKVVVLK